MAILATEKILTLDYWKPANTIQPGDYVFDKNGKLVKVKLVQIIDAQRCYEITFNDHLTVAGDSRLAFPIETPKYRKRTHEYKGKQKFRRPLARKEVEELTTLPLRTKYDRLAYSVPTAKPLELPYQDLPVPPFVFGLTFCCTKKNKLYSIDENYVQFVHEKLKSHGYEPVFKKHKHFFSIFPTIESQLAPNIPTKIPANYLLANSEQRIELLRGILYAKRRQYSKPKDSFRITNQNFSLIRQIQALVESLGHRTTLKFDETKKYYTLYFKSRLQLMEHQVSPPVKVHHARRFIREIEPIPAQQCIHIETDGDDNSFLVGEGFIACR